ncbi:hypothetical protein [Variovorax sp. HJSM1_2]|uniref:hypothetical protein n=1 Tax=Variovorax sp. HJSM1_2 TaxID=3366263 RepID=UPI003BD14246
MAKSVKNMLLTLKVETTSGTDAAPTAAANSILVRNVTLNPITAEFVQRNNIRGYKGNFGSLAVGVHRVLEFEIELAGAGAAGTAPKWAPALKACGFSETLSASTSAVYQPVSSGEPTVTCYGYLDGLLFKLTGSKGTVSFELNSKQIPVMKYKFLGEYSPATDVVLPTTADFSGYQQPLTVGKVNTPSFSAFGQPMVMQSLTMDMANALAYRDLVGAAGPTSADRSPAGSMVVETASAAVVNWGEITRLGTKGPLSIVHGTTAGNIIQADVPYVQVTAAPTFSEDNSVSMTNVSFSMIPNTGNDEFVLTVK